VLFLLREEDNMFQVLFRKKKSFAKILRQNEELEQKLYEAEQKLQKLEYDKEQLKNGIGNYINEEYLIYILDYVQRNKPAKLTLISTVEYGKELNEILEECFVGFRYGIKIMDNGRHVITITTLLDGDSCVVSAAAAKRRKSNVLFGTMLAHYLKEAIGNLPTLTLSGNQLSIEIKEQINVGKLLFEPEARKSGA
jgi:hypothetical protein